MKAALYCRVSTEDQASETKTSLAEQLRALRERAERDGYEIVDEIREAVSGRKSHTEGLARIYDLAYDGAIDTVLVYKWNRFARTVARYERVTYQLNMMGVDVVSLDGQSNKTPSGRFFNRIIAAHSELQRDDLIQTMKVGTIGRARSGRIIPPRTLPNGFVYDRDNAAYVVDDVRMLIVRRAFRMIAVEGKSMRAVAVAFRTEGVPTVTRLMGQDAGSKWHATVIRKIVLNDVYKPHSNAELAALVAKGQLTSEVFDRMDPNARYGVQWYNRTRTERDPDTGRRKTFNNPESDWVAVPVPDAGIPREWVEKARAYVAGNIKHSSKNRYPWGLKGRVFCPCGATMTGKTVKRRREGSYAHYYVCNTVHGHGDACGASRYWPARDLEDEVRGLVLDLIKNPEVFTERVRDRIEAERATLSEPERAIEAYALRLAELEKQKHEYWDMASTGDMPRDVMRVKVKGVEKREAEVRAELDALQDQTRRIDELAELEDDLSAMFVLNPSGVNLAYVEDDESPHSYAAMLDKLKLEMVKHKDGRLVVKGDGCQMMPTATRRV